jgi:hypothetical protein
MRTDPGYLLFLAFMAILVVFALVILVEHT